MKKIFAGRKDNSLHPFSVMVKKEIADHTGSWRFIIMVAIILLTSFGSILTAMTGLSAALKGSDAADSFFFLRVFTATDGSLPSFFVFISFIGPLLGISMGFDAINSEHNRGTLSRLLAQPVHRDYVINAKFVAAIIVISILFFSLGFLVMGMGLIAIGIPPTPEEFLRIIFFLIVSILYVSFWLNLSILFSVRFRQPATSALSGIAVWMFLTVFYSILVGLIAKAAAPSGAATMQQVSSYENLIMKMFSILPSQLFSDATTILLVPSVRSLGPLTMEQVIGTIPGPLPLGQSLLLMLPQITGLIAATVICFVLSYLSFMRREIRPR